MKALFHEPHFPVWCGIVLLVLICAGCGGAGTGGSDGGGGSGGGDGGGSSGGGSGGGGSGGGGSTPAPTVSLSGPANATSGQSVVLTWTSTDATTCTAFGAWSGSKGTAGSETIGPLTSTATYSLSCTGSGGSANDAHTVSVAAAGGGSLAGLVDSSLVNRSGENAVYVFQGAVTPDDTDGDAVNPVLVLPVSQDNGACTWSYASSSLASGQYTIAFTSQAALDNPASSDSISFYGSKTVSLSGSAQFNDFAPSGIIRVGPSRTYKTVAAANAVAGNGAIIEIDAGTYVDDVVTWRQNNLTLRGVGGRAHMRADSIIPYQSGSDTANGMGIWVVRGSNTKVENIEFSGARVPDENGAGIRNIGSNTTICNNYFHDNENGILGGAYGVLTIEFSEFNHNGIGEYGRTHNLYIDDGSTLVFRHNYTHHAYIGHNLKSRAANNYILYNRIMDEASGQSSYAIDLPNGDLAYIIGNLIQQGPNTDNSIMVNYGSEGLRSGGTHQLYLVNNTLVNDRGAGTFLSIAGGASPARLINNIFAGGGTVASGSNQQTTNLTSSTPGLVNRSGYNYELTSGSAAINAGTAPGTGNGYSLTPAYQYIHQSNRESRPANGAIDIGAYEYQP